jgi:single-stranded-DNA-specific exonuclease
MPEEDNVRSIAPFLGVDSSFTGRFWRSRISDDASAREISRVLQIPDVVGRVLAGRGVTADQGMDYLNPTLRNMLPDPSSFRDMDSASERVCKAVQDGEAITIFGDYDVDGATSTALLTRFFRAVGANVSIYIPDRITEGYGPNAPALRRLAEEGVKVVITVDCGTTAHNALHEGRIAGLDVVVVDHHAPEAGLPEALAVINPNRIDEGKEYGQLAAVGVAFLLAVAVNRALRECGWYRNGERVEPDLRQWLDLVALGTVCDVVPLLGLNRALVVQGFKVMASRTNAGLVALADVAGIRQRPGTYHAGFVLGPRVNAGGRVGQANLGAHLLSEDNPIEAERMAAELDRHNLERKTVEAMVLDDAKSTAESMNPELPVLVVAKNGWHPGVIGIVASRLTERYRRPTFVIATAEGIGKGSGRSVRGVDIGAAVIAARQTGLLVNGGGHPMAAGLTVKEDQIPALEAFLCDYVTRQGGVAEEVPSLDFDGALSVSAATTELVDLLERAGPYGTGNAEPRFAITGARIVKADIVGSDHVRCILSNADGGRLKTIAFRRAGDALGEVLLGSIGTPLHLAGHLRADEWNGRRDAQLIIEDAATPR